MKKVNVLGTDYTIEFKEVHEDSMFTNSNGYCDYTGKRIVVLAKPRRDDDMDNFEFEQKRIKRHEIVHAFLCESGLIANTYCVDGGWAKNEEMVDWIAIQFPKMLEAFKEADAL